MTSPEITDAMVEAAEAVFYKTQGDMRAALSAALAAGAPMSRVKPLEWRSVKEVLAASKSARPQPGGRDE